MACSQAPITHTTFSFDSIVCGVPLHSEYRLYSDGTYYMEVINGMSGVYDTGAYIKNNDWCVLTSNEPEEIEIQHVEESFDEMLSDYKIVLLNKQKERILYPEYIIVNLQDTINIINGEQNFFLSKAVSELQYYDGDTYCSNATKTTSNKSNVFIIILNTLSKSPRLRHYLDNDRHPLYGKKLRITAESLFDECLQRKYILH